MSTDSTTNRLKDLTGKRCISSISSVDPISGEYSLTPYEVASLAAYSKMFESEDVRLSNESKEIFRLLSSELDKLEESNQGFAIPDQFSDLYSYVDYRLHHASGEPHSLDQIGLSKQNFKALYIRLWMRDRCLYVMDLLLKLENVLQELAQRHSEVLMPVYSNLQPVRTDSLSKWWLTSFYRLKRDFSRLNDCFDRINVCPLSTKIEFPGQYHQIELDKNVLNQHLGFSCTFENNLDSITDCDSAMELSFCATLIGTHLSQLANELEVWSSWEFGYLRMPRKPIQTEHIGEVKRDALRVLRKKCALFTGDLVSALHEQKGHHVSYSQDLESVVPGLIKVLENLEFVLEMFCLVLPVMIFDTKKMEERAKTDLANSGGIFDYLVERSYEPDQARNITSNLLEYCRQRKKQFVDLTMGEWREFSPGFDKEVYQYLVNNSHNFENNGGVGVFNQMELDSQLEGLQDDLKSQRATLESRLDKFLNNPCEDRQTDN